MENHFMKSFSAQVDFLLPHRYRIIGMLVCFLSVPGVSLIFFLVRKIFGVSMAFWSEWGLYLIHVPLSLGLYLILFSEEKNEDEFYLSLRLRSIARGVIVTVSAMALLPFYANLPALIVERNITLPDVGGNMAVCTLLLVYANVAYAYNKSSVKDD